MRERPSSLKLFSRGMAMAGPMVVVGSQGASSGELARVRRWRGTGREKEEIARRGREEK